MKITDTTKRKDEELVALAQDGDQKATEDLLVRYLDLVRSLSRGFFLVGGETEDLIQEGMIGLYQAIGEYRKKPENGTFKTFAYLCVYRRIVDAVKASARKKNEPLNTSVSVLENEFVSGSPSPEELMILSDDRRELKQKMSGVLSDFEFKIVVMYMDGMTCAEICETTGKSIKSIDNAIQRSKRKLQQLLKR